MAVELCRVALWLEAHNPGMPLTFLDHRIKCGDAIVGVARFEDLLDGIPDEAFKTLDGDDKDVASTLRKRNKDERKTRESAGKPQLVLGMKSRKDSRLSRIDFVPSTPCQTIRLRHAVPRNAHSRS